MRNELLNILTNSNKNIDNQHLMAYLSGKLKEDEIRLLEEEMIDSDMLSDAVEGLSAIKDINNIDSYAKDLNTSLKTYLNAGKERKPKRKFRELPSVYFTIALVLLIAIIAFVLIYFQLLS